MLYGSRFKKFLMWHELLPLSLAIYLGTVLQKFLESIVKNVIVPATTMVMPITASDAIDLSFLDKYGFNFKEAISQSFSFSIAVYVCYLFVRYFVDSKA